MNDELYVVKCPFCGNPEKISVGSYSLRTPIFKCPACKEKFLAEIDTKTVVTIYKMEKVDETT